MVTKSVSEIGRKALNLRDTSEMLGISISTIRRLIKSKKLNTIRYSERGHYLVPVTEINRILKEN